ncbi:MAG: ferrous iron transport protein B [Thermotogota bacterium]
MAKEIALIGNPNVGKTSIFNLLTGTRQYVANWPGVTVERKVGISNINGQKYRIVDLPGIYTLSANSEDEKVARDFFINEAPDTVVLIADALNLERTFYLLLQLIEMNLPVILAINSIDEAEEKNKIINTEIISKTLNIPVVLTSAKKNTGIDDLRNQIESVNKKEKDIYYDISYPDKINDFIRETEEIFEKDPDLNYYNKKWLALNIIEFGLENSLLKDETKEEISSKYDVEKLQEDYINWKFEFISSLSETSYLSKGIDWSLRDMLDHVFTHKILGIFIYILALFMIFSLTFTVSAPLSDLLDMGFGSLADMVSNAINIDWLSSLLAEGIISGVGGVLVFIPQIFTLFFFMGFLEESGYLPRAAFLVDKLVRKFGLSGRSFMSIILGFGCNVPAIMSAKAVSNKRERLALILSIPFASCSARLPVYILLISAFFSTSAATIMLLVYVSSIFLVLISAKIIEVFIKDKETIPFTIEMPRFRMPTLRNLILYTWNKGKHFLEKAGGIILIASILVWVLSYFPNMGQDITNSYAASIGKFFEPLTKHLEWDWRINTGLFFGVAAKEIVVSTYSTLYAGSSSLIDGLRLALSPQSALALIFFVLGYVPCFATLGVIKSETKSYKLVIFTLFYTTIVAYLLANIVYYVSGWIL